jgi:chitinase
MNIDWTVKYYIEKGAPKYKLILGLGMYGRSFALKNKNRNRPGDFAIGPAHAGRVSNSLVSYTKYGISRMKDSVGKRSGPDRFFINTFFL